MIKKSTLNGTLIILVALSALAVLGTSVYRQMQLDSSSQKFAVYITPLILADGAEVLRAHAHPTLFQQISSADFAKYLQHVSRNLGELQLLESISGSNSVPLLIFNNELPSASYDLEVMFAFGPATVKLELIYAMKEWRISAFVVESNRLAD